MGDAEATPAPGASKEDARSKRLESLGRLRIDLRTAEGVRAGNWRVLARVGEHTVDFSVTTRDRHTEWAPGEAGRVIGDGVKLASVIKTPLELTVWGDQGRNGQPPVRRQKPAREACLYPLGGGWRMPRT